MCKRISVDRAGVCIRDEMHFFGELFKRTFGLFKINFTNPPLFDQFLYSQFVFDDKCF